MNQISIPLGRKMAAALLVLNSLLAAIPTNAADAEKPQERRGTHIWIERPWNIRYVLVVEDGRSWTIGKKIAIESNAKPGQRHFQWEEFFEPTAEIEVKPHINFGKQSKETVAIEFDKQGFVTSPNTHAGPLRGRLNRIQYITLSVGDGPVDRQYDLGNWFTGIGDASTDWAPGICGLKDTPSPFSKTDNLYLYGPKFEIDEFSPTFGCREWAAQLYDDARPYIDITSYVREGKTYPKYTYIRNFIGWARFGDKKPVIGKQEEDWYCLHDCPDDGKPGLIPDIKAWAVKNGWNPPRPPTKMPVFPDPPASNGRYPQ
nr:hypothetical protein [uncultured Albidiferax sp.]